MLSLWGDSQTGPEARTDYLQLGVDPTFPGGGTTFGFRTKYNDDNGIGAVDAGVERKESDWTKLAIEADSVAAGGQVRFFIDDVLVGTSQRTGVDLRWVMLGGLTYTYDNYWYDDLTVETYAGLPGDFDLDRDVDGGDFLAWQKGNSPMPRSETDLADWRTHYGVALAPAVTAVPEPRALTVLAAAAPAMLALSARLRRRRETIVNPS
jgi:hypothetical protein